MMPPLASRVIALVGQRKTCRVWKVAAGVSQRHLMAMYIYTCRVDSVASGLLVLKVRFQPV